MSWENCDNPIYSITIPKILEIMKSLSIEQNEVYFSGSKIKYGAAIESRCSNGEISKLEKDIGYSLPADYKAFLLYTNGLKFASNLISSRIFCLEEIYDIRSIYGTNGLLPRPKNFLPIGSCVDNTVHILINLEDDITSNMYMVYVMEDTYFSRLKCSFTTFFERFIISHGSAYWEWGAEKTNIRQRTDTVL